MAAGRCRLLYACLLVLAATLAAISVTNALPVTLPSASLEQPLCQCLDLSVPHCLTVQSIPVDLGSAHNGLPICVCKDGSLADCKGETSLLHSTEVDHPATAPIAPNSPKFWWMLGVTVVLVLIGGIFAGLTIGLMSLDTTNLQILKNSGTDKERVYAEKIEPIRKNGHWLLSTLLLGNVVVNETLPILFHDIVGGGIAAVIISTGLVVLFGEIIPNAVCARHGLAIGARLAPLVKVCMWLMFPLAYPIAKLLDYILGTDEGIVYKRAQLKTLVALHEKGQEGEEGQQGELIHDEVGIISAVLDLKDKTVRQIMTPLEDVFMLEASQVIDVALVKQLVTRGHSRVPVYQQHRRNLVAILLAKRLIGYNVEKPKRVSDFPLTYLPIVDSETSLFDMLNFFQEGRSHMAAVAGRTDGGNGNDDGGKAEREILGIITLEDVIEELIGEEIIDETDQFTDMHSKTPVLRTPIYGTLAKLIVTNITRHPSPEPSRSPRLMPVRRRSNPMRPGDLRRKDRARLDLDMLDASMTSAAVLEGGVVSEPPGENEEKPVGGVPGAEDYFSMAVDEKHSRDERLTEAGWVVTPMNPDEPLSRKVLSRKKGAFLGTASEPVTPHGVQRHGELDGNRGRSNERTPLLRK